MPLFTRPTPLPQRVRAALELERADRVLASAELTDGWAVASRQALHLSDDAASVRRRPWSDVDHASLDPETLTLTVEWVDGTTEDLHLADGRHPAFTRTLRERVQSSVVHTETVSLPGGAQARVALRRGPDGDLFSQVTGRGTVDLTDPRVAALVDAAEARVRSAAGLPR
ncbi:hypothetical protein [Pengzhenrongella sicca]|uniref:Uncharacterized protein n=1 Tax=Pengzhenrongella sicca TaxID=2819238 RepID=A0A8A4Z9A9_9MICO|nr:hypothetical protein [Pengzhenrongella sicca]QTE28452.1 hypothetical protein J4E96_13850 [Pengzhenrongella sicca]